MMQFMSKVGVNNALANDVTILRNMRNVIKDHEYELQLKDEE